MMLRDLRARNKGQMQRKRQKGDFEISTSLWIFQKRGGKSSTYSFQILGRHTNKSRRMGCNWIVVDL